MMRVYLQHWEESERGWGIRPDGCSLHFGLIEHDSFIKLIYENRENTLVPKEYERIVGRLIGAYVKDDIYKIVMKEGTLRLNQYEMSNLIKLEELEIIC